MKKPRVAKTKPAPSLPARPTLEPTREQIAMLAYSFWLAEGRPCGRDREHWLQAEAQLRLSRVE